MNLETRILRSLDDGHRRETKEHCENTDLISTEDMMKIDISSYTTG